MPDLASLPVPAFPPHLEERSSQRKVVQAPDDCVSRVSQNRRIAQHDEEAQQLRNVGNRLKVTLPLRLVRHKNRG
jgi:hypothetical protein